MLVARSQGDITLGPQTGGDLDAKSQLLVLFDNLLLNLCKLKCGEILAMCMHNNHLAMFVGNSLGKAVRPALRTPG